MTVAAQTFTGAYDSFGRYRLKLTIDETAVNTSGNSSSGTWTLTLEGVGGYDFNGWSTSGSVTINGGSVASWNEVRPSGSWSGSVTLANGSWSAGHTTNGTKTIAVSASFNATGTPDSYGPGSVISVSGNYALTDIARVPTTPPQATVSNLTTTGATLSWGASTFYGTTPDYAYYLSKVADFATLVTSGWQGNDRTKDYTLERGTTYYHRNRAKDSEGTSGYSTARSFTTPHTKPDKPIAPSVGSITQTSASVNTTDPAYVGAAVTGRETQVLLNGVVVFTATTSDPTFSSLTRSRNYTTRFRVQNAIDWSDWSNETAFSTPGAPPSAPTGYTVTDIASTTAKVSTGTIADNGGVAPSKTRIKLSTTASDAGLLQTITLDQWAPVRLKGLAENTPYYVAEAAYNDAISGGWGPYGAWVPFTTLNTVPNQPTLSVSGSPGSTTATLQWTMPSDLNGTTITGWVLRVANDLALTVNVRDIFVPAGSLSQVVDLLVAGTQYYAEVWSQTGAGNGSTSNVLGFVTSGGAGAGSGVWIDVAGTPKFAEVWLDVGGVPKLCEVWIDVAGTPKKAIQ